MRDAVTGKIISSDDNVGRVLVNIESEDKYNLGQSVEYRYLPSILFKGTELPIVRTDNLKSLGYAYNEDYDLYYKVEDGFSRRNIRDKKFRKFPYPYEQLKLDMSNRKTLMKYGILSPSYLISEHIKYSFGVEIETSSGYVPASLTRDLNVKCVYDGSLYDDKGNKAVGGEFVSGVLRGDAGFIQLKKILSVISKRTRINKTCSVHVHIGGLDFNKANVVMLWKVAQVLEKELYSMMPNSRKHRQHCQKIDKPIKISFPKDKKKIGKFIDDRYDDIVRIISLGKVNSKIINKAFNHPMGHYCGYNTSTPRYWWINFVPALFNLKGLGNYTIEYRMHSASTNYIKIRNWILIVMAMTYVAENNHSFLIEHDKFTIQDILKLAYKNKWKYLSNYVEQRKAKFRGASDLSEEMEYKEAHEETFKSIKETVWD